MKTRKLTIEINVETAFDDSQEKKRELLEKLEVLALTTEEKKKVVASLMLIADLTNNELKKHEYGS